MTTDSTEPTAQQVLDTPLRDNDAGAATIRDYLTKLLLGVWEHKEGFDGKRPFGNSGWDYELYDGLARAGLIDATYKQYKGVGGESTRERRRRRLPTLLRPWRRTRSGSEAAHR